MSDLLALVEADGATLLRGLGRGDAELSLTLTDDPGIAAINAEWRGIDAPTDVLSFPQETPAGMPVDLLGDVIISVDAARRQAVERGHELRTELRVLLVHGLCHLLGHDHGKPDEARVMIARERELLQLLLGDQAPAGLVEAALGR